MKKGVAIIYILLFALVFPSHSAKAERMEYLYVLKDDFVDSDSALVVRTAPLYKDEIWVIEYGIGCSSMWSFEDKYIIAKYSTFLDGIGGEFILPQRGNCRNWDADELEDIDEEDLRYEDWDFLREKGLVSGLSLPSSIPSTPLPTSTYACPLNATSIAGQCICNQGYQYHEKSSQCISYSESCRLSYGPSSYGDKEYCYCSAGYQFNSGKTACVAKPTIDLLPVNSSPASSPLISSNASNPVTEDHWFTSQLGKQVEVSNALVNKLSGRILLQPQEHGEAWYLDPVTKKRYYMKDGAAAYQMLRSFGMGIANADLERLQKGDKMLVSKLKGRIVLQVQARGEAFYVHPITGIAHYLKDGAEAYRLMRELSLGVTNNDIYKIPIGEIVAE